LNCVMPMGAGLAFALPETFRPHPDPLPKGEGSSFTRVIPLQSTYKNSAELRIA
jgi:hypothetical protein